MSKIRAAPCTRFTCSAPDGRWARTTLRGPTKKLTGARLRRWSKDVFSRPPTERVPLLPADATQLQPRSCEMALYDRRTLDVGAHSVRQSVIYIQNYRYAEERMMRMMAGWIALTPELAVKLEMAKQVYEDALHTDALGKRLPELRAQPQVSKPANEAFVTFMNAIEDKEEWEDTIERLVGIYRVLKPHLISH